MVRNMYITEITMCRDFYHRRSRSVNPMMIGTIHDTTQCENECLPIGILMTVVHYWSSEMLRSFMERSEFLRFPTDIFIGVSRTHSK